MMNFELINFLMKHLVAYMRFCNCEKIVKVSLLQVSAVCFRSVQNVAHHSHPHLPHGGSLDDNHSARQP